MQRIYLLFMVLGTVLPWWFFGSFFTDNGFNLLIFFKALAINDAIKGVTTDITLSSALFWLWAYNDAKQLKIKNWWLVIPSTLLIGLSLALPLYFYLREINNKNEK